MSPGPVDRFESGLRLGLTVAVSTILVAIAAVCFIEVARRPFGQSFVWYDEFVGYLLVWLTFLGAALARSHHEHIGVDNLVERAGPLGRKVLTLSVHAVMIGIHVVLLVYGSSLVSRFLTERAITVDVPIGLVYSIIPGSAALMIAIELIAIWRSLRPGAPAGDA